MKTSGGSEIEFCYTEGSRDSDIPVRLDGRVVGDIIRCDFGWYYKPRSAGGKIRGEIFDTVAEVQRNLVGE